MSLTAEDLLLRLEPEAEEVGRQHAAAVQETEERLRPLAARLAQIEWQPQFLQEHPGLTVDELTAVVHERYDEAEREVAAARGRLRQSQEYARDLLGFIRIGDMLWGDETLGLPFGELARLRETFPGLGAVPWTRASVDGNGHAVRSAAGKGTRAAGPGSAQTVRRNLRASHQRRNGVVIGPSRALGRALVTAQSTGHLRGDSTGPENPGAGHHRELKF